MGVQPSLTLGVSINWPLSRQCGGAGAALSQPPFSGKLASEMWGLGGVFFLECSESPASKGFYPQRLDIEKYRCGNILYYKA